jgi:beta-lactamase class A
MTGSSRRNNRIPAPNALLGMAALVLLAGVLAGCTGSESSTVSAPIDAPTRTAGEVRTGTPIRIDPIDMAQLQNPPAKITPVFTPIPTITPTPNPIPAVPQTAEQEAVRTLLNDEGGVYGYVLMDASGAIIASYNSFTPFVTASTYKLIVMADIYQRIEAGEYSLDEEIYLDPVAFDANGGDNYYNWNVAGSYTTLESLLYAVGIHSSNVAAHTLLTLTTTEDLNATAKSIGMVRTYLMSDPNSLPFWPPQPGIDSSAQDMKLALDYIAVEADLGPVNLTTPYDMAVYMNAMVNDTLISPWVSEQIFTILSQQAIRDRLPVYNWNVTVANKPGNLAGVVNDVGVLYLPGGARSVAALSINVPDDDHATKIIQLLGLIANGTTDLS